MRECDVVDAERRQCCSVKTSVRRHDDIEHRIHARESVFTSAIDVLRNWTDFLRDWNWQNVAKSSVNLAFHYISSHFTENTAWFVFFFTTYRNSALSGRGFIGWAEFKVKFIFMD